MHEIDNEKFGQFLLQLRREKALTQRELAERLYVSDKAVSKWERGLSLPDIALLQPLAGELGVTVTELLSGQRLPQDQSMPMRDVEALVGGALHLTAEEQALQRERRQMWGGRYVLAALALALEVFFLRNVIPVFADSAAMLWFPPLFGAGFGVYFIFLAKEKLPSFYDQYKINFYSDGILRMNVAGVYFNNRNWPHILRAARTWCCAAMAGWAPVFALLWLGMERLRVPEMAAGLVLLFLALAAILGGLFLPVYVVGRKYE